MVDLPAPLRPASATMLPASMHRSRWSMAARVVPG